MRSESVKLGIEGVITLLCHKNLTALGITNPGGVNLGLFY